MRASRLLAALAPLLVLALPAGAADEAARTKEQLRHVVGQVRELEDSNAQLSAKQAEYERKIADLTAQLSARDKEAETLRGRLGEVGAAESRSRALAGQVQQDQAAIAKWSEANQKLAELARGEEADHKKFQGLYEQSDAALKSCRDKNKKLFDAGMDAIAHLEDRSFLDEILENEPFTQKARVKLQNLEQDLEDKLLEQKITTQGQ